MSIYLVVVVIQMDYNRIFNKIVFGIFIFLPTTCGVINLYILKCCWFGGNNSVVASVGVIVL